MKFRILAVTSLGVALACISAAGDDTPKDAPKDAPELKDVKSKASYSYGILISRDLKTRGVELDLELVVKGLKDGVAGKAALTDEQINAVLQQVLQEAREKSNKKNKAEGEAFLAANAKKEGVVTLPSGLQYKVIKEGTGPIPKLTDKVLCNYRGTLIDGTEFDSSYKRNMPAEFPVNGVIAGWIEALQKMKVGSKWQLFVPSNLAYGERSPGPPITPNSTLIFDIELLEIK
jgi:FKBP-type peptidyl-prolyl cis-trans isomerase FklB